jgi:hypothetical protein
METALFHHLTLKYLQPLVLPLLEELRSVLKVISMHDLYVLYDTFLSDILHHFFRILVNLGFESTNFAHFLSKYLSLILLTLELSLIPIRGVLDELLVIGLRRSPKLSSEQS